MSTSFARRASSWSPASLAYLVAGIAAVLVLFWQFGFDELADALSRADGPRLLAAFGAGICVRLGYAWRWRLCARALDIEAPLSRFITARLAGDAVGIIIPAGKIGGDPLRIALLRSPEDKATSTAASVALDRVMEWIGNSCYAIAGVTIFALTRTAVLDRTTEWMMIVLILALAMLITPLAMMRAGLRPLTPLHALQLRSVRLRRWLELAHETETSLIDFFRSHPRTFTLGTSVSLLIEAVILLEYNLLLGAFGVHLGWPTLMMTIITGGLARSVPVPGGLGVFEASEVALLALSSGDAGLGFVVGIVFRFHEVCWATIGFAALATRGGLARLRFLISTGKAAA